MSACSRRGQRVQENGEGRRSSCAHRVAQEQPREREI